MHALEHELGVAFLLHPDRRARWRVLFKQGTPKARDKATSILPHGIVVDERYATRIAPAHAHAEILAALLQLGAPETCHVISEGGPLDGRTMGLEAALAAVYGSCMGTLISCVPGHLAYYEGKDPGERYILHRP